MQLGFFAMLTPGWRDNRTQWKNCHISPESQAELTTEKGERRKKPYKVFGTVASITERALHLVLASVGLGILQSYPLARHSSTAFQYSVCTPTSGIHGKLQQTGKQLVFIFFKSVFLNTCLLMCESHLYHGKVVVILLGWGLHARCKDSNISAKTRLALQLTPAILIHIRRRLIVVIKKWHQV